MDRLLRFGEVQKLVGLSRVSVWRMERLGKFPKRRKLGLNSVAWISSEIDEWILNRPVIGRGDAQTGKQIQHG